MPSMPSITLSISYLQGVTFYTIIPTYMPMILVYPVLAQLLQPHTLLLKCTEALVFISTCTLFNEIIHGDRTTSAMLLFIMFHTITKKTGCAGATCVLKQS